jgi:hypothetical protein
MARIPGTAVERKYGKLDVIGSHLRTAIQMISISCSPFSTHLVVMACREMIMSVAEKRGVLLDWDYRILIKDEHHKAFKALMAKPYNYLKHADRDSAADYDGPKPADLAAANEVQTLANMNGYNALGGEIDTVMGFFVACLMVKHPGFFKLDFLDAHPDLKSQFGSLSRDPTTISWALRDGLFQQGALPRVPATG